LGADSDVTVELYFGGILLASQAAISRHFQFGGILPGEYVVRVRGTVLAGRSDDS
jgi:hypothetical protein